MLNKRKIPKTIRVKRKKFITEYINNKTVIHIGCTGGLLGPDNEKVHIENYNKLEDTHYIFSKFSKELSGLDISKSKIEFLKSQGFNNLYTHDICDLNFNLDKKYDVVLFPNIIEHLSNVGNALQNIKKLMRKDSKLIITTNNAFDILVILKLFFNYESVHDEHTSYYSYSTMKRILTMNELKIENFYFAFNEKKWSLKNNKLQFFLKIFQNSFGTIFKQFSEDLIFVVNKE
jgi:SAM-dependent methyltransferase